MGMKFRKSKSSGPFRVTVSKSGLHTSVGGKGFRVGVGTNGKVRTTVSIPGTGISYTRTSGSSKKSSSHSRSTYSPSAQTSNPNYSSYPTYENGSIAKSIIYFVVFGITLGLIIKHPSFVIILGVMALYFLFKGILNLPTKIIKVLNFNFTKKKIDNENSNLPPKVVTNTENGWICPDCKTENSNTSTICKNCGRYK